MKPGCSVLINKLSADEDIGTFIFNNYIGETFKSLTELHSKRAKYLGEVGTIVSAIDEINGEVLYRVEFSGEQSIYTESEIIEQMRLFDNSLLKLKEWI